jgi:hypothetical protein
MTVASATGFVPGEGVGIVGAGILVLVERTPDAPIDRLIERVSSGGGLDDVFEILADVGLRVLGSLVVAAIENDGLRLVVRGDGRAVVTGDGDHAVNGAGLRTWNEQIFTTWDGVRLSLTAEAGPSGPYWLDHGVVSATTLVHPADLKGVDGPAPTPGPTGAEPVSGSSAPNDPGVLSAATDAEPSPPAVSVPEPGDVGRTLHQTAIDDLTGSAAPVDPPRPAEPGTPVVDASCESGYDALYGHTILRSVQGAAMTTPGEASAAEPAEASVGDHDGHTMSLAQLRALQHAESAAAELGDHDGHTINVAQLLALRSSTSSSRERAPATHGTLVQALVCRVGHPNPTQLVSCQRCGAVLTSDPVTIPRPVLGRLVLSTGDVIELDRPALIGRNPKVEQGPMSELPRIVQLEAFQGLSRSHAMIRLEGWQVLVDDLGSANHTVVTLPGRQPRRLHAGEQMLITHGASIDFGGEVTATYDAFV